MHPLSALATRAIRSLHTQLERTRTQGTCMQVVALRDSIRWWERQKQIVENHK